MYRFKFVPSRIHYKKQSERGPKIWAVKQLIIIVSVRTAVKKEKNMIRAMINVSAKKIIVNAKSMIHLMINARNKSIVLKNGTILCFVISKKKTVIINGMFLYFATKIVDMGLTPKGGLFLSFSPYIKFFYFDIRKRWYNTSY
jgi:hypothetical protein